MAEKPEDKSILADLLESMTREQDKNPNQNPYDSPTTAIMCGRNGLTTARYVMDLASHDFFQMYMRVKGISEAEVMRRAANALIEQETV